MNNMSLSFKSVSATIWITRGNHHFFQCSNSAINQADDLIQANVLCQIDSLRPRYPNSDEISYVFKPLYCDSRKA